MPGTSILIVEDDQAELEHVADLPAAVGAHVARTALERSRFRHGVDGQLGDVVVQLAA